MGVGSYKKLAVPVSKVGSPVKVIWPYWLSAIVSLDWNGWNQTPARIWWRPFGDFDVVGECEEIARDVEIASIVAARKPELRLRIGSLAAANYHRAYREARQEAGNGGSRSARSRLACEEISRAREAKAERC